jgi:signal transduction histidine kinase/TolB-like protein/Flp pilus assembly protein TadD
MLDVPKGAALWRSLRNTVAIDRLSARIASAMAVLAGGSLRRGRPATKPPRRAVDANEPDDPMYRAQNMEALGRLTGGIAHDFNNLLTVVLGNATALRVGAEAAGDANSARRAEMIERAAERGGRLAGQLLAYSGKQMLRPDSISAYQTLSATSELLAQAAGESVRVRLDTEPSLWNCRVDPGQLESAVLNLVLNARDAMPAGGSIVIQCRNHRLNGRPPIGRPLNRRPLNGRHPGVRGDYVRIDVTDTGCGIPPELQDMVFEPFFTTKSLGQGSGLGLSQVYGFVGQSGGWVDLESKVGHGTTLSLFLPRDGRHAAEAQAAVRGRTQSGEDQTVLVVEPDPDLRATTCDTLSRASYRPLAAANGSEALAYLVSDAPIHLLLTEADLPGGVSGVGLAHSARHVRADLRALVTSSRARDAPGGGDTGFEFLMKPYRPHDLVSVVGAVLARDSFSVETEDLLANAWTRGAPGPSQINPVGSADPDPAHHGLHHDAIRLGVMPFRTVGSTTDGAFSMGLAEEITTAFARFRSIVCIAPASVAALAGEPTRQTERWQQLDLDFLIEGSVRRKANEIRVLLRLVHMRGSGEISWSRRFDSLMPEVLNLQDQIAAQTAAQIAPEVMVWEGQAAASRKQVDPTAYDLMLRAIPAIYRLDEVRFRAAGGLLEQSLALDPSNAACHSWLAHWYLFLLGQGWAKDPAQAAEQADTLSQQAVILDPGDARGFTMAGHVRAFLHKDAKAGLWLHERALALNPNLALAWCYSGLAYSYLGQHAEAIRRIQRAKHLSPHDPHGFFFENALETPLLLTGQYEAAARAGRRARSLHPGLSSAYKSLLAALGHLGASREATEVRKALLQLEPGFSVASAIARSALLRPEDRERYAEGLRLAGIPERSKQ